MAAPTSKMQDMFISHASEDNGAVERPLAELLKRHQLTVRLDSDELTLGDRLSEGMNAGLAHRRFGVVIRSPSFSSKSWPRLELDRLLTRELQQGKVILPPWPNIDQQLGHH
jgi:hypothetical protein